MPDREKVIKRLECCSGRIDTECDDCPYNANGNLDVCGTLLADDALALLKDEKEYCNKCAESAIKTTVELQEEIARLRSLLKEQEAVEARKENDGNLQPWTCWWYVCGDCGQKIDYHDRFCRWCGRAVKWE